jgi:hypothetical protein
MVAGVPKEDSEVHVVEAEAEADLEAVVEVVVVRSLTWMGRATIVGNVVLEPNYGLFKLIDGPGIGPRESMSLPQLPCTNLRQP